MNPKEILNAVKKAGDVIEQSKNGDHRRQMEGLKTKAKVVFDSIHAVESAAKTVSGVINTQRESQAKSANVYAQMEDRRKKVESDISIAHKKLDLAMQRAQEESIRKSKQIEEDFDKQKQAHEERMLEAKRRYDLEEKKQNDSHELAMAKLTFDHEAEMARIEIDRLKEEREAALTEAKIREMDAAIENNRPIVQTVLESLKMMLGIFFDMLQSWELTPDNRTRIEMQQQLLLKTMPRLQALPIHMEE